MYSVPAVVTASRIMKLLARSKYRQCTLTEISQLLSINKSTCLRVLRTLQQEELIRYNERTRTYTLGSYLIILGNRASDFLDDLSVAKTHLAALARDTGQTAILAQRAGIDRWICIAKEEPPVEIRITITVGQQFPIEGTSLGRCFMAFDDETDERFGDVRERGYVISMDGFRLGISSAAAPIFDKNREVTYVLALLAVTSAVSKRDMQELSARVKLEAERVSTQINRLA